MATVNYSIAKNGNEFRWPADDKEQFRLMRSFLLCSSASIISSTFIGRLVDCIDDLLDLKPGEEKFFITSEYECIARNSLAELNRTVNNLRTWIEDGDINEHYRPSTMGFTIKRTNKLFIYHAIYKD